MNIYKGTLNQYKMSKIPKKAYNSYNHQKKRCYSKTNKAYLNYGAKGIKVEYSVREFIAWFLKEYKKFNKNIPLKFLDIGRIDHSKNYSFDNIRLESRSENTKERNNRLGNPINKRKVLVTDVSTGKSKLYDSTTETAKDFSIHQASISFRCKTEKIYNNFRFKYLTNKEDLCL